MSFGRRRRSGFRVAFVLPCLLAILVACTTSGGAPPAARGSSAGQSSSSGSSSRTSDPPPSSAAPTSAAPTSSSAVKPAPHEHLHPRAGQLTRQGMWWAVDSVAPIDAATLANVRGYYRGAPTPVVWGRYVSGHFRASHAELAFARAHGIGVYFIVPDDNCSVCAGGGDVCGNDRTAAQAQDNAHDAVVAAQQLGLPRGVTLYKDIEEVGACHGELTADYLLAWYRDVRRTRFVPAFYGNTNKQDYDFPRAFCAAVKQDPRFAREVTLAQDEPEPQLGAARRAIGPRNAPRFAPYRPHCTTPDMVRIWQYGESISNENATDVDEVVPGTHGILAPDGHVT